MNEQSHVILPNVDAAVRLATQAQRLFQDQSLVVRRAIVQAMRDAASANAERWGTMAVAETMMGRLKSKGIGGRPFFLGLHAQPVLTKLGLFKHEVFPHTDQAYKRGLYLPSGLTLTKPQIDVVCAAVREIAEGC